MAVLTYVQGDSKPSIRHSLRNNGDFNDPIDVSAGGVTVRAYVRKVGAATLTDTLVGVKSTGLLTSINDDTGRWTVDVAAPWNVAGVGGIVLFNPLPTTFPTPGMYEYEVSIDYGSGQFLTLPDKGQVRVVDAIRI